MPTAVATPWKPLRQLLAVWNPCRFDLVDLKYDLEKTLSRKVDLVTYNSLYWRIRDHSLPR